MAKTFMHFDYYSEILFHLFYFCDAYKAHSQMKSELSLMISGRESSSTTDLLITSTSPKVGLHYAVTW